MPEQLDLFSSIAAQEPSTVHQASAMLLERRLKPPAVIMQNQGPDIVMPKWKEEVAVPANELVESTALELVEEKAVEPLGNNAALGLDAVIANEVVEQEEFVDVSMESMDKIEEKNTDSDVIAESITENKIGDEAINILPEITPATIVPISEPIAIIAVKPIEEEKAKSARGRKSIKEMSMEADLPEIPEDEKLFSKQYYGIGEVATMFHVNASLLRYWETEFDVLKPKKNGKGDRFFRPEDIKNLQIIHHLLRQKKFTIQGAKDYLKNNKQSKEKFEMVKQLQQLKSFLLEMKAGL